MASLDLVGTYRVVDGTAAVALYQDTNALVFGFLFYREAIHPTPASSITLGGLFEAQGSFVAPVHAGLVFLAQPSNDYEEQGPAFAASLLVAIDTFPSSLIHRNRGGLLLWLGDIGPFDLGAVPHLRMVQTSSGWVVDERAPSAIAMNTVFPWLLASSGKSAPVVPGDGVLAIGAAGAEIVIGTQGVSAEVVTPAFSACAVAIGVDAGTPGEITFASNPGPGFEALRAGFMYSAVPMPTLGPAEAVTAATFFYPLFDPGGPMPGDLSMSVTLGPWPGEDGLPRQLSVAVGGAGAFDSAFRTTVGGALSLGPGADLVLQPALCGDGSWYLMPSGSVTVASPSTTTLVCGLSGMETLTLPVAATIQFGAGAAGLWASASGGQSAYVFPANPLAYQTAWMSVSTQGASYAVQSPGAPFFTGGGSSILLPAATLPGVSVPSSPFPIVPYGGIAAMPAGPGTSLEGYAAFEANGLAPKREAIITGGSAAATGLTGSPPAVTPQGFVVGQSGSRPVIQFGAIESTQVSFSGDIVDDLLSSLTAAQPFLAITSFQSSTAPPETTATMDGWAFDLTMPSGALAGTQYTTVMIVKAAGAAIAQLAASPATWTDYAKYNDTSRDPAGLNLSAYLTNYIRQAQRLHAGGDTDFESFVDLVEDPDWSGVLYIAPAIDISECDASLQPLLVGVSDACYAHHLAIADNNVSTTPTETANFQQTSAVSGLVAYVRPGTSPTQLATGSAVYVTIGTTYDFQVLLLRAVFANSTMTTFQSAAQVVIGSLFGDTVVNSPVGAPVGGCNVIPLVGTAHIGTGSGGTTYALGVPSGYVGVFYLNSAAVNQVTLNKASALLQTVGAGATAQTQLVFNLGGWIGLRANPGGADLLSYDTVAVGGIILTVTYEVGGSPIDPTFAYDDSALLVAALQELETPADADPVLGSPGYNWYRAGSFVAGMPVSVNALTSVQNGQTPTGLGYQPVSIPGGVEPTFSEPWYALVLDLTMGTNGAAGSGALLTAQLMLAWAPGGAGGVPPAVAMYFGIQGPDGFSLDLSLEGALTLGARSVSLLQNGAAYTLVLQSIGLTVLSKTFPSGGQLDLYLAGFLDEQQHRALGWFGGYSTAQS